jgi:hypothetical protein
MSPFIRNEPYHRHPTDTVLHAHLDFRGLTIGIAGSQQLRTIKGDKVVKSLQGMCDQVQYSYSHDICCTSGLPSGFGIVRLSLHASLGILSGLVLCHFSLTLEPCTRQGLRRGFGRVLCGKRSCISLWFWWLKRQSIGGLRDRDIVGPW